MFTLTKETIICQFFRYASVGLATLALDVTISSGVLFLFPAIPEIASGIGFMSGFFISFPLNRRRVFPVEGRFRFSHTAQVGLYIALSVLNLIWTSFVVGYLVRIGLEIALAKVIVTGLSAISTFFTLRFVVFKKMTT